MNKLKIITLFTFFIVGITSIRAQETKAQVVITLERTPCFGACPVYSVSIYDDGKVTYNGGNFVEVTGEQTSEIDPATVTLMVEAIEKVGYFDWDEAYNTRTVSDLPTVTTSVTRNGQTHRIVRYAGDDSAPLILPYLELWIDEMANTELWTGVHPEISNIPNMNPIIVTMERGACYGFCPVDKMVIFGDGTGIYMGIANVDNIGVHTFEVESGIIPNLIERAEIFGYFDWKDSYEERLMTDQATVITTIQTLEHYKHIVRYTGDPNAPVGLIWIEDSIAQLLP